ncbi:hypothetical protein [Rubrobacter aplysinae]|uniref:hypothetical protein n=1 Tax=Rubrobacter aplysinae TaxID=909625 RepID=UPI00064C0E63|nr:hypothetical protein [Rubrobacter aplysinae]
MIIGSVLTLVAAVVALRAGIRAFVTQVRLRRDLASEVDSLGRRAGELTSRTARLEESTRELPVTLSRTQENLAELRILSGNLYVTLTQMRRILSYSGIKTSGTSWLSKVVRRHTRSVRG